MITTRSVPPVSLRGIDARAASGRLPQRRGVDPSVEIARCPPSNVGPVADSVDGGGRRPRRLPAAPWRGVVAPAGGSRRAREAARGVFRPVTKRSHEATPDLVGQNTQRLPRVDQADTRSKRCTRRRTSPSWQCEGQPARRKEGYELGTRALPATLGPHQHQAVGYPPGQGSGPWPSSTSSISAAATTRWFCGGGREWAGRRATRTTP